jgi:hypothetical protein
VSRDDILSRHMVLCTYIRRYKYIYKYIYIRNRATSNAGGTTAPTSAASAVSIAPASLVRIWDLHHRLRPYIAAATISPSIKIGLVCDLGRAGSCKSYDVRVAQCQVHLRIGGVALGFSSMTSCTEWVSLGGALSLLSILPPLSLKRVGRQKCKHIQRHYNRNASDGHTELKGG